MQEEEKQTWFMIAHGGVEGLVGKETGEHVVECVDWVELIGSGLIPDIMRREVTGIVNEIGLR